MSARNRFRDPETGKRETPDETFDRLTLMERFEGRWSQQRRDQARLRASLEGGPIKLGRGQRRNRRKWNGPSATFAAQCEREWSKG